MPSISIVMPVYKCGRYIQEALNSIRCQTLKRIELIVVDAGGCDITKAILDANKDIITRVVTREPAGIPDALNYGFHAASGRILCWLNGDDLYVDPRALEYIESIYSTVKGVDVVFGDSLVLAEDTTIIKALAAWRTKPSCYLAGANIFTGSFFFSKDVWKRFGGFDTRMTLAFEYDLIAYSLQHFRVQNIPKLIAGFRKHPFQLSKLKRDEMLMQHAFVVEKYGSCSKTEKNAYRFLSEIKLSLGMRPLIYRLRYPFFTREIAKRLDQ